MNTQDQIAWRIVWRWFFSWIKQEQQDCLFVWMTALLHSSTVLPAGSPLSLHCAIPDYYTKKLKSSLQQLRLIKYNTINK